MGIGVIDQLGDEIEARWRARDYELGAFPALCAQTLSAAQVHVALAPGDIIRWALAGVLPRQLDPKGNFGQPPITLFRGRRFVIDALYWVDGTTVIHDHGFSGAFQLLAGSSIETTFSFSTTREVDGHMRIGALSVSGTSLLARGDIRTIEAGPDYIHALFHLHRPSVSLVIRTLWDPRPGAQFQYSPAGIAFNSFLEDETRDRLLQIVDMLRKTGDPEFETVVGDLIAGADLHTAFRVVRACVNVKDQRIVDGLLRRVRDKESALLFRAWLEKEQTLNFLYQRRTVVHDPALRFCLAVLLNAHRRRDALALAAAYVPGAQPERTVAAWLARLAGVTMRLQAAGAPFEPNALGLPAFDDGFEELLGDLLADRPRELTSRERAFADRLRSLPFLAPLFRD